MKFKDFLNESSLSRIWKQVSKYESGTITAHRSAEDCLEGDDISIKENRKKNRILKAKLLSKGYRVTKIKGVFIENFKSDKEREVNEESFIVIDYQNHGTLKKDLMILGENYEQDSITYSKPNGEYYLIGTNHCPKGYPGYHVVLKLGSSFFGKRGQFYSKVRNRPFVFESIGDKDESLRDHTVTEIRSILAIAEQDKLFND